MATRARTAVAIAAIMALTASTRLTAQDTRLDHFGAGWARLDTLCTPVMAETNGHFHLGDYNRPAAPDSTVRRAACFESHLYDQQASTGMLDNPASFGGPIALSLFVKMVTRRTTDTTAANALAALALDLSVAPDLKIISGYRQSAADLLYAAVRTGNSSPLIFRACTRFNLVVGDLATARYCSAKALREGADSSWHLIRWSWLASLHHDSTDAARLMQLAIARAHDSASSGEVDWFLAKVSAHYKDTMTPADSVAAFAHGLKDAEAEPDFLGDLYAQCPIWLVEHGSHSQEVIYDYDIPVSRRFAMHRVVHRRMEYPIG
jgi:hypothetical protein